MTIIRRVPLDFAWPLNKVWGGFVLDEALRLPPCPDCVYTDRPTGYSPEAWGFMQTFYASDMPAHIRGTVAWHDKIGQKEVDLLVRKHRLPSWETNEAGERVMITPPRTAAEVNAAQHTRGFDLHHDGINESILVQYRCKRLGLPYVCTTCSGTTDCGTPEQVAAYKKWKPTKPPKGKGWQAWEDVSEGSPISPVFATREGLIDWFTDPNSTYGQGRRGPLTRDQAEALVNAGSTIGSAIAINGRLVDGDRAVAALDGGKP